MAKFCGKCGTRLDVNTGLCPKCDADRFPEREEKPQKSKFHKRYFLLPMLTVVILLGLIWELDYFDLIEIPPLSKCHHEWKAATCTEPRVCILCGAVEGNPLGHTPGEWQESRDPITCQLTESVNCINCGIQLDYRVVPMDSLVYNDVFVFTPYQFLERFSEIVQQNYEAVSYEITSSEYGTIVYFYYGDGKITLLNFLHPDMSAVMEEELNQYNVYCVSAHFLFQEDATDDSSCVQEFFMACDPKLDENSVYTVTVLSLASLQEAFDAGYCMNTFQYNELLYDVSYFEENRIVPGYDTVLSFSIYPAGIDVVTDGADIQT